jgi:hypothetical protein
MLTTDSELFKQISFFAAGAQAHHPGKLPKGKSLKTSGVVEL